MKILSLRLSNLASIADEHVIHFEQEPLKNAGLIAITGVTGAGKTTLLDAICLALFDQIPRLQHAESLKKITDVSGEELLINSTKNILRRGCVQGFAEVEFMAQDGKQYLARWEVKRARLKASGKLQDVQRALRCISDNQLISERTSECNKKITELLGLTFQQFTRAVLLAQSEVTAFLKAKDSERADLLEYLTNSDIYSRIGMASFAATKQAREKVESIQHKMGHHALLSDEQRQTLHLELAQTQQAMVQQHSRQQQIQQQINWYGEQQRLNQQLEQQQIECNNAQQQMSQFQPQISLLAQLEQFEPIRDQFVQRRQLEARATEQQQAQHTTQQQLDALQQQLSLHVQNYQQQLEQLQHSEQQQQRSKPFIQQAQQLEHQLANLSQQMSQQQHKLNRLKTESQPQQQQQIQLQQQLSTLTQQQSALEQTLSQSQELAVFDAEPQSTLQCLQKAASLCSQLKQQDAELFSKPLVTQQAALNQLEQQLATLKQQYQQFEQLESSLKATEQQVVKHDKHLQACDRLEDQLKLWEKLEIQQAELQQRQTQDQQQLASQQVTFQQAQAATQTAEHNLKNLQQLAQEQRLLTSQNVTALREQLQPEHPCMVCGSTQHPFFDPQVLINTLNQQFDQPLKQAELNLQQARQQENSLHKQIIQLESSLQQHQVSLQQLSQNRQMVFDKISEISPKFYQRLQQQDTISLHFANERLYATRTQLNEAKQQFEQTLNQQQTHFKQWQTLEKQQQHIRQFMEKHAELAQLEQQVIAPLNATWYSNWQQDCQSTQEQLSKLIQARLHANNQLKQQEQQLYKIQQDIAHLNMLIAHAQKQQAELQQQLEQQQQQQQQTAQQLAELFTIHATPLQVNSSSHWQTLLEQQLSTQQQQVKTAEHAKQALENQQIRLTQQLESGWSEQEKTRQLRQQNQQNIEEWQAKQPQFDVAQAEHLLTIDSLQKQQLQLQRQQLQQSVQHAEHALSIYKRQLQQHLQLQPATALAELEQQLVQIQDTLTQLDDTCTALKVQKLQDEQQQTQAQHYAIELQKAKAEHHRWDKISSLIGDAKGARFKNLAQQFHLHMLVEMANQQLRALTPRYELRCLEDSLGLTIVDHYMNDEIRPVLSLSGGESFLVSLALALGIANMASGTTKLESLFIDEGFGTLDQSSLHVVMDALDRLQSQGRKVILISHISDMHERIPVKIQVLPQGSGASRIEVVG